MKKQELPSVLLIAVVLMLGVFSCTKSETFPESPAIEYTSHSISDSTDKLGNKLKVVRLKFSFKDKEGDIGLAQQDTAAPYDHNLNVRSFRKVNSEFVFRNEQKSRILSLEEYAGKNGLQGYIEIAVNEYILPSGSVFKYEIYIFDRALHKSNVITSPEIQL